MLVIGLLAGCLPEAPPGEVTIRQVAGEVTFYPQQAGIVWRYLKDGERLDALPVYQRVEGPTVVGGEVLIATRLVGRGLDVAYLRRYGPEGVYLVRETRPGALIDYDPPMQELPSETALGVGASWGGVTTARLSFPQARAENQRAEVRLDYRYTVVDRRRVSVAAGNFDVFVINLVGQRHDEEGLPLETLRQELWFAPHIGEVRTRTGFFLVEANFQTTGSQE